MIPFQLIPADTSSTSALWDIHSIPFMSAMGRPGDLHLATLLLGLSSEVRGVFFLVGGLDLGVFILGQ